jgi:hypothetical protein
MTRSRWAATALARGWSHAVPCRRASLAALMVPGMLSPPQAAPAPTISGPGAAHVLWTTGAPGREAVERVFERSARLNGDAVVVFMRSLAAISQEELVPVVVTEKPRCAEKPEGRWGLAMPQS